MFQELEIPFTCVSISEKSAAYQAFIEANFPDRIEHAYRTMADQICGEGCLKHVGSGRRCGNQGQRQSPRLAVFGTPCDPFSKQRSKRWCDGSVKAHGDFATTFQDVYQLLEAEEPLITIMEQVDGFDMPFSSTDRQSPRERPAKGGCGITDYSCFYFDVSLDSSYFASHVTSH